MLEKKFYMVGIIHGDSNARKRLRGIIEAVNPDVITVEFTHYGLNFRKNNSRYLRMNIKRIVSDFKKVPQAVKDLLNFLALPYEYLVAADYAGKKGIPLYLVDMDFFSFFRLRFIGDMLDKKNLFQMAKQEYRSRLEIEKRIADLYFEKNTRLFRFSEDMRVRDEYTSRLIKKIMEENSGKLLHICGWQHLIDEQGYFSTLNPEKIYIYDKALGL